MGDPWLRGSFQDNAIVDAPTILFTFDNETGPGEDGGVWQEIGSEKGPVPAELTAWKRKKNDVEFKIQSMKQTECLFYTEQN